MRTITKPTKTVERLLDARAEIVERVWGDSPKLYNHAILCSVGLPYRNQGDDCRTFTRTSGATSLRLEAGAVPASDGSFLEVGLPFGPRARLLLLHLCSEAIKRQEPIVEVEDSFTSFARSLGLATNGRNHKTLRDQILRMSAVSMRLSKNFGSYVDVFQGPIFSKLRADIPDSPDQLCLWTQFVEFSPEFFESLRQHAVPLRREAVAALKHSSRCLDVYAWLAYRLWRVPTGEGIRLRWTTLRHQFGRKDQNLNSFKRAFKTALSQVLLVYPEANVRIVTGGVLIQRSAPPVKARPAARLIT